MSERFPKQVLIPRYLENSLKQMGPQELDKVLSVKFYTEVRSQKEMEMITSWNPFKSCRVPLNGHLKEKNKSLGILQSREFHNSKEIQRRITLHRITKIARSLRLREERKAFHH